MTLPRWKTVKGHTSLEQELILLRHGRVVEFSSRLSRCLALFDQEPVAPAVEAAARRIGLAPPEVVDDIFRLCGHPEPTIEVCRRSQPVRKRGAGDPSGDRNELLQLAIEQVSGGRQQQRDLIALRVGVRPLEVDE